MSRFPGQGDSSVVCDSGGRLLTIIALKMKRGLNRVLALNQMFMWQYIILKDGILRLHSFNITSKRGVYFTLYHGLATFIEVTFVNIHHA